MLVWSADLERHSRTGRGRSWPSSRRISPIVEGKRARSVRLIVGGVCAAAIFGAGCASVSPGRARGPIPTGPGGQAVKAVIHDWGGCLEAAGVPVVAATG